MQRLRGRVAVITGAASGIGRALAIRLAEEGCSLALVDLQAEALRRVGAECRARGAQVSTHAADVSDRRAMAALPERVVGFHGAAHLLINNAGVTVTDTVLQQSIEDWEWVVGINLWGVVYGTRAFLPHLMQADEAHIVNLSSVFGLVGVPGQAAYCSTKFAVRGFSESLSAELAGSPVCVSVVHPGMIRTNIVRAARHAHPKQAEQIGGLFARFGRSPERAADTIVRGIRRGQRRILIGYEAHILDALARGVPGSSGRVVGGVLRWFWPGE